MALILEVLDAPSGALRSRLRLDALPLNVGRALDNDLILDDPYVDARHARITVDATGTVVVEDLGSVNGLVVVGGPAGARAPTVQVQPGAQVRVGRTTLRFRALNEAVVPALIDGAAPAQPPSVRWLSSWWIKLGLPAAAGSSAALNSWLHSYERNSGSDAVFVGIGVLILGAVWAGIWAVAARVVVQRFHFLEHLATMSAAALAGLLLLAFNEWAAFLFPDNTVLDLLSSLAFVGVTATLIAGQLAFASTLSTVKRWRAGIITGVVLLALGAFSTLADREVFSDVPEFSAVLKPMRANWLPAGTVESFGRTAEELKRQVDQMAAQ